MAAQVGTMVANFGRELPLLKMAINMANADNLSFFLWNELEPRCQQRAAGSLELDKAKRKTLVPLLSGSNLTLWSGLVGILSGSL